MFRGLHFIINLVGSPIGTMQATCNPKEVTLYVWIPANVYHTSLTITHRMAEKQVLVRGVFHAKAITWKDQTYDIEFMYDKEPATDDDGKHLWEPEKYCVIPKHVADVEMETIRESKVSKNNICTR